MPSTTVALNPNETSQDRLRQPVVDRPTYDCPTCGERSMQFFRILPATPQIPERINTYLCFACGRAWQM